MGAWAFSRRRAENPVRLVWHQMSEELLGCGFHWIPEDICGFMTRWSLALNREAVHLEVTGAKPPAWTLLSEPLWGTPAASCSTLTLGFTVLLGF